MQKIFCKLSKSGHLQYIGVQNRFKILVSIYLYKSGNEAYMFLCAVWRAMAASPMTLRTSVLVEAFSNASLWNSIVDNVPSI